MSHRPPRAFTLIELLVVIAIIGILSAVVLASLNTARTKGNDSSVKGNMHSVVVEAGVYRNSNYNYGTFDNGSNGPAACPTPGTSGSSVFHDTAIERAIASALKSSGGGVAKCLSDGDNYVAYVSRPGSAPDTTYWCVEDSGKACGINTEPTGPAPSCGTCAP